MLLGEVAATFPNGGTSWAGGLYVLPWWIGSVGEAISMIGYERNCDWIKGTFYVSIFHCRLRRHLKALYSLTYPSPT